MKKKCMIKNVSYWIETYFDWMKTCTRMVFVSWKQQFSRKIFHSWHYLHVLFILSSSYYFVFHFAKFVGVLSHVLRRRSFHIYHLLNKDIDFDRHPIFITGKDFEHVIPHSGNSQSRGPVFKTTGWFQGWLNLSSFLTSLKWIPGISGNLGVKSKLPPWSGSSLEAVKPHP